MTDQLPPGWENQVPPGPHGQPAYPPSGQQPPPGHPSPGQPPQAGGYPRYGQAGQPPPYPQYWYGPGYGQPGPASWSTAPEPGGVPLRPLALGDILNGSVILARRSPAATFGLAAIVATVFGVGTTVVRDIYDRRIATDEALLRNGQSLPQQQLSHLVGSFYLTLLPTLLLLVVLAAVGHAVLTGMLSGPIGKGVFGRTTSLAAAWQAGRVSVVLAATLLLLVIGIGVLLPLVVAIVVLALAHLAPLAILLGILGGIGTAVVEVLLWVRLSLTMPAVVLERISPVGAVKRSWRLTRGSFWRLFGILLLTLLIVIVAGYVLALPFAFIGSIVGGGSLNIFAAPVSTPLTTLIIGAVGSIVAATVTRPIGAGVNVLLYVDLRMRREGLDLAVRDTVQNQALTGDEFAVLPALAPGQGAPGAW
ncbi:MAG TPA: glycerophosphoryl diester phosphodiesterase membrane domain-containing protein [Streptosporangiaceae bacterium]|nr:glycerophosphoryl diester phosphodiesterase membrane domain-containing protein [Streptosporangiaceae bacterium]